LETSDYTEMINLLKEEKRNSLVQARTTGDWDLKLQGAYQQNAVAAGYSDSRELFFDQPKDAFQVGLQLTVPLGSARSKAEKHAVLQTQMGYDSKIREIEKLLHTQHERALKSLSLLEAAVGTQDMSVKSLRTSVDSAKRKYSQARISQVEYILEQDKLFSTEVDTIQSRLLIINEVLDYLKVFNKQHCKFNKVIGA
jgi:outer membrane protein TolC